METYRAKVSCWKESRTTYVT